VLEDLLIKYVGNHLWWKKVEALKGVVMPIICSMRITDTRSPNLHLAAKAYHDMKVQVSAAISEHPLITPGDRQIIVDVLEKRNKVFFSWPARAAAGANPKYFYGKDFELWEEGKDTLAMQSVVGDYYSNAADDSKRKAHVVNAMKEWSAWTSGSGVCISFKDPITVAVAQDSGAFDYWSLYHNLLTNFGPVAIMLCSQQADQGTSERMHQVTKQVRTKTRNKQSGVVGAAYTEIKMGILQQRATDVNAKKIIQRIDKVSLLGLVCEKMALRVSEMEKTEAERVVASTLVQIQAVPAQSFVDFEVEDIENEMLDTSIAHGGGVLEEEDAVSALLSLAGWVNVVEEDMEEE